jgi:trafficking protein particle complex subunit 3
LTYGAVVGQLLKDFESVVEVNNQLEKMFVPTRKPTNCWTSKNFGSFFFLFFCFCLAVILSVEPFFHRGYNIGLRIIDDFLAKSSLGRCADLKETGDVIGKVRRCF